MAKEKHKRGNKKSGGGRTNELNRRKKKFSTGEGGTTSEKPVRARTAHDFYSSFMI